MLVSLLRIPLTLIAAYGFYWMLTRRGDLEGGDIITVVAYGLFAAIAVAILWAPVIGEKISDPLTTTLTTDTSLNSEPEMLVRCIRTLQTRGYHRFALILIIVEGIRHPRLPHPALLGLRSAKPGSLLERWLAKEVYQYNNIQNCLHAYRILKDRHGIPMPPHRQPEVNLAIMNLTREPGPEPSKLKVKPGAVSNLPPRNERIKLFSR